MLTKSKQQLIAEQVPSWTQRVVDIGCAQEPNRFLIRPGRQVYGIDLVPTTISGYEKIYICDLNTQKLPFENASIETVTMGCVLAHVASPLKVLAEINRVLTSGGTLVLSTPNPNYYWETVLNIFYHQFKRRVSKQKHGEHFYSFSRYTIRTCAERAGFVVFKEIGATLAIVKTPLKFNPTRFPSLSYEIIYVMKKIGEPKNYITFNNKNIEEKIGTKLYL